MPEGLDKEDIKLDDIERILVGYAPELFLAEVAIRTVIIYLFFLVIMRWLGKRMVGQLAFVELAIMLSLGAIVAPAVQIPERGVAIGILALFCVLFFQQVVSLLMFVSRRFHSLVQGRVVTIISDGVIDVDSLRKVRITRQEIFAALRNNNVFNLGSVERLYIEAYGDFTIYKNKYPKAGLSIAPRDADNHGARIADSKTCGHCGYTTIEEDEKCWNCGNSCWMETTLSNE